MKEKPLISIIVPVYNVKNYLVDCVNSIVNQTYKKTEIILVDDGSTDKSGKICDYLAEKDNRIKVIHKKNGGLSSARNAGMMIAKGKYIGFVDSDDKISKDMYEILLNNMLKTGSKISICGRYYVYPDGTKKIRYKEKSNVTQMNAKEAIIRMNSFSSFDMAAWDKLYDKKIFNKIYFPEGKLSEDFFIMYKLFIKAKKICYTPQPLYYYFQREGSISHSKNINLDFIEAARQQMKDVTKIYPSLYDIVGTAFASANMTLYDMCIKRGIKCPPDTTKKMQDNVKKYFSCIKGNKVIPKIKLIQGYLFINHIKLYDFLFKLKDKK